MDAKAGNGGDRARALEIFAAIMREGSFSAAGRTLGLTPSAVARSAPITTFASISKVLRGAAPLSVTAA